MNYVTKALTPGEQLRAEAKLHWIIWFRAWAALIFLGILIVGIVIFVRDLIFLTTTEVALTDRRLIVKTGWLERHTKELELTSVEMVTVDQGFWGRLLDFGRVEVHGTGDDIWETPTIARPVWFRREIQIALSATTKGKAAAPLN